MSNPRYNKWKNKKHDKRKREFGYDFKKRPKSWKKNDDEFDKEFSSFSEFDEATQW